MKNKTIYFELLPGYPNEQGLKGIVYLTPVKDVEIFSFWAEVQLYYANLAEEFNQHPLANYHLSGPQWLNGGQTYPFFIEYTKELPEQEMSRWRESMPRVYFCIDFYHGTNDAKRFLGKLFLRPGKNPDRIEYTELVPYKK